MKFDLESMLVDTLTHSLNILIVSKSSIRINNIQSYLLKYKLLNIVTVRSVQTFKSCFFKQDQWNLVILDTSLSGKEMDDILSQIIEQEYWIPIIVTGNDSDDFAVLNNLENIITSESGIKFLASSKKTEIFECRMNDPEEFLFNVQKYTLLSKLFKNNPTYDEVVFSIIQKLFTTNPKNVDEWYQDTNISLRKFQTKIKSYSYFTPKRLIVLYHAYRIALNKIEKEYPEKRKIITRAVKEYNIDEKQKTQIAEYVLTRKTTIFS